MSNRQRREEYFVTMHLKNTYIPHYPSPSNMSTNTVQRKQKQWKQLLQSGEFSHRLISSLSYLHGTQSGRDPTPIKIHGLYENIDKKAVNDKYIELL